jgi:NAD(P)-dependent dehydrogenase (short-subunit alcohol dehydrogenase family)
LPEEVSGRRVAVVTGASSGIGAEIARLLAGRGDLCVLLARRADRLQELADELGGEAEPCDISDRSAVEAVAARVLERHPRIGVLVNNAGIPGRARFLDGDPDLIERLIRVNYLGGVWCLRAFLPGLRAAAPSDVVNIVSVAGVVAAGPYSASKHAQLAFSRTVAAELRGERIQVHTVKPGYAETEGFPQKGLPRHVQRIVIGPEDVAAHVLHSLEDGRGETTVPWFYGPLGVLQDLMPNVFARVFSRGAHVLSRAPKAE